ncbi:MAG TPA: biotin--[acetyl-CoA-carboxylase] ligase, partial [Clostridia bacterium]|nr:biotin--[acetyl-CoA-carboxylase] ligase [Clostridia bacterium]
MAILIGKRIVRFHTVTSTNDVAKEMAEGGEPEGTVVVAGRQTAGKGRLGRNWVSRAGGGLWAS